MTAIAQTVTTFEDGTYEIEEVADDPFVARFLSPDPIIQSPGNAQNYNRYSYALNNPLKYTDPSGYKYRGADMGDSPGGFFNHGFKLPQNGTIGSGNHWSDGMMGEYYDFVFGSSKKFDSKYGVGAHNIGWSVWSDSYLAEKWRADDISIYDVDIVEVFEVKTKTENWVGTEKNPYQILVSTDEVTSYELVISGIDQSGEGQDNNFFSINGKITIGLQAGENIGITNTKTGLFVNFLSCTLIGYDSDTKHYTYPGGEQYGTSQWNQSLSGGYMVGGEIWQSFNANILRPGYYNLNDGRSVSFSHDASNFGVYFSTSSDGSIDFGGSIHIRAAFLIGIEANVNFNYRFK